MLPKKTAFFGVSGEHMEVINILFSGYLSESDNVSNETNLDNDDK
jgi:hypothetical protein